MKILVTNDDGIHADGLRILVRELRHISEVVVVAPAREQSAIGTAITLRHPLRAQKIVSAISDVETYAVSGTPADSVIMGLSKLAGTDIDFVISGINHGLNLGDDILISGTVGGALQGYLHGISSIAVSTVGLNSRYFADAAKFTGLLASAIARVSFKQKVFLNVNVPDFSASEIAGIKVTRPSTTGYADTVEKGYDGRNEYYWLRHKKATDYAPRNTDAWAVAHRDISVTPLHTYLFNKTQPRLNGHLTGLLNEMKTPPKPPSQ